MSTKMTVTSRQATRSQNNQIKKNMNERITVLNKVLETLVKTKRQRINVGGHNYSMRQMSSLLKKEYSKLVKFLDIKVVKRKAVDAPMRVKPEFAEWINTKFAALKSDEMIAQIIRRTMTGPTNKKLITRLFSVAISREVIKSITTVPNMSGKMVPSISIIIDDSFRALDPTLEGVESIQNIQLTGFISKLMEPLDASDEEMQQVKDDIVYLEGSRKVNKRLADLEQIKTRFMLAQIKQMESHDTNPFGDIYRQQMIETLASSEGLKVFDALASRFEKVKPSKSVTEEKIQETRELINKTRALLPPPPKPAARARAASPKPAAAAAAASAASPKPKKRTVKA